MMMMMAIIIICGNIAIIHNTFNERLCRANVSFKITDRHMPECLLLLILSTKFILMTKPEHQSEIN